MYSLEFRCIIRTTLLIGILPFLRKEAALSELNLSPILI